MKKSRHYHPTSYKPFTFLNSFSMIPAKYNKMIINEIKYTLAVQSLFLSRKYYIPISEYVSYFLPLPRIT